MKNLNTPLTLFILSLSGLSAFAADPTPPSTLPTHVQLDKISILAAQALIDPSVQDAVSRIQAPNLIIKSIVADFTSTPGELIFTYNLWYVDPVTGHSPVGGYPPPPLKIDRTVTIDGMNEHVAYKAL